MIFEVINLTSISVTNCLISVRESGRVIRRKIVVEFNGKDECGGSQTEQYEHHLQYPVSRIPTRNGIPGNFRICIHDDYNCAI